MKKLIITFIWFLTAMNFFLAQEGSSKLTGHYLGQQLPGLTPKIFAPGIISTDANEGCCSFSKDGNLFLFARGSSELSGILIMEQIDGVWTEPKLAPFSAGSSDWDFMLASDDKTVFVSSGRPLQDGGENEREYRIYVSEKTEHGWTSAVMLPPPVNTGEHDSYPSVASNGTLYFFSNRSGGFGEGDIYKSQRVNGKYPEVENLGEQINTDYHEVDAFIAPDESYMIFCTDKPGGFGRHDIYVTFRNENGEWSDPMNMGEKINTSFSEYIPYISPDGKYFFFTSNKSGNREIYWMDSGIIDELKQKNKIVGQ